LNAQPAGQDREDERLVIASFRGGVLSCLFSGGTPVQLDYAAGEAAHTPVGGIYAARVQTVRENVGAAFLDLGEGLTAWYSLSADPEPVFLREKKPGKTRLVPGDELLVKVKRAGGDVKKPAAVSKFPERRDPELLKRAAFVKVPGLLKAPEPVWHLLARKAGSVVTNLPEIYTALTGEPVPEENAWREKLPESLRGQDAPVYVTGTRVPVSFYCEKGISLRAVYSLETAVASATERKVWLKSGGFLVIDRTEAMTVIDVNSGKNEKGQSPEETFLRTDREAAAEIMRQLRLRNLSGIVLVDFINLRDPEHQKELMKLLREKAAEDPVQTEAVDMTKLNLVEIVRRKRGRPFAEQLRVKAENRKENTD